ncbi:leucyl aminopeptidase [Candidatus Dependentiae bacterium]|nr:MAG: leucyl aminopeptidase [Candidatus Dependentiae bacterium]
MLSLKLVQGTYNSYQSDGYFIFLPEGFSFTGEYEFVTKEFPHAQGLLKQHGFTGKKADSYTLSTEKNGSFVHYIFLGLGDESNASYDSIVESRRRSIARGIQIAKKLKLSEISTVIPAVAEGGQYASMIEQLGVAAIMMTYEFETFKSSKKDAKPWSATLTFLSESCEESECQSSVERASIVGHAMNSTTRYFADLPPNIATPTYLSKKAEELAKKYDLSFKSFGREKAESLGMGGFCSVDIGSDQDGKFVILEYKSGKSDAPTIALCGKGVTFDTGGISLKPSNYMTGMKYDMSGAAAVLGIMSIIGQLKPAVNLIGLMPFVENMPSGKASRQDDIITHLNGKTTEIKNTDAEGRLILSDALAYAEEFYKPDTVIDIATLTGACVVALGHFYTGLISNNDELIASLRKSGQKTGDRVWPLPLDDDYRAGIKSEVADIANIALSSYSGGTIEAAVYLQNFVTSSSWAHLDIAGTAHDVPAINYVGKGSTGASVRLLVDYILSKSR